MQETPPAAADRRPDAAALDRLGVALWAFDFRCGRIVWANRAACALWDARDADALAERDVTAGLSPGAARRLALHRADLAADPERIIEEQWTLYPGGRPTLVTARMSAGAAGRDAMVVEAVPALAASPVARRAVEAMNQTAALCALFDGCGRELYANPAMRATLGPRRGGFGACFADPEDRRGVLGPVAREGRVRRTVRARAGGREIWLDLIATRCADPVSGAADAFFVTAHDVTAEVEARAALAAARDAAEAGERIKEEFLSRVSHELRTPLNAILGLSAVLRESILNADQRRALGEIARAGARMLSLVEDMLDLDAAAAEGPARVAPGVDAQGLLDAAAKTAGDAAAAAGVRIETEVDPAGAVIAAEPEPALGALQRLVENAVVFAGRGVVRVRAAVDPDGAAMISVADEGPGVLLADQARIFERFEQVDGSATRAHGGAGLGLAVARALVRRLGGEIGVESAPGAGALFWFRIPPPADAPRPAPAVTPPRA